MNSNPKTVFYTDWRERERDSSCKLVFYVQSTGAVVSGQVTDRQTDRQTYRLREREIERQRDTDTERERDRERVREETTPDRQTETQRDRDRVKEKTTPDRQTKTETCTHLYFPLPIAGCLAAAWHPSEARWLPAHPSTGSRSWRRR